jgi:hypothetical protein
MGFHGHLPGMGLALPSGRTTSGFATSAARRHGQVTRSEASEAGASIGTSEPATSGHWEGIGRENWSEKSLKHMETYGKYWNIWNMDSKKDEQS